MSLRTIGVVFLALICGLCAAVGVNQLNQRHAQQDDNLVSVVTVIADIARGDAIEASSVRLGSCPREALPKGAVVSLEDAVGRTALVPLVRGERVLQSKLADKNDGFGLAALIPEGMRAFTIQTSHVAAGVAGLIRPGNKVDVLLTTSPSDRNDATGGGITTTLLQNVQVLAVAQKLDVNDKVKNDPNEVKSVTLLVTPAQAARLDLGMNKGILHLALRSPKDNREADAPPATLADLRFHQEKPFNANAIVTAVGRIADAAAGAKGSEAQVRVLKPELPATAAQSFAEIRTLRGSSAGTVRIEVDR